MSAKLPFKRTSMVGALSVADRAKRFQSEPAQQAAPSKPAKRRVRNADASPVPQPATAPSSAVSPPCTSIAPSLQAECSSSQASASPKVAAEPPAITKHTRRISVSTPLHRRARSDVSILDPFLGQNVSSSSNASISRDLPNPPTIRTSSFAEIEELTAKLEANRPRSKTLAHPNRARASSVLMHSITETEESMQLRLCSSTETIRGLNAAACRTTLADMSLTTKDDHDSFQVSPCLSEDGSIDWHRFVSGNYGAPALLDFRRPISITDLAFPVSTRQRVYQSKLCKPDSPILNDEATWLEEELARCSSDEEDDEFNAYDTVRQSMDEEYLTPEGSPLLSPVNIIAPPSVEIMGLGIQDPSLLLPGEQPAAEKSADSLLEQVAMHEACIQTLHTLSHDERDQATAIAAAANNRQLGLNLPPMPNRRSSLLIPSAHPALRGVASNGDFSATQSDSSALFGDDTYDASMSPMADMGHGAPCNRYNTESTGVRRASAASYLSTGSTASADISVASHGSSLLFNAHLAAPSMERGGSADTVVSTRPSSIASSFCHERAPIKPPRSPLRMNSLPLPPLPQEACETPQLSQKPNEVSASVDRSRLSPLQMDATPLPPVSKEGSRKDHSKPRSSKESARVLRQANRRKEGMGKPEPPARFDSLDAMVSAAPKETQLKEEFPDRLLGDWMSAKDSAAVEQQESPEHRFHVEPVPVHKRIHKQDGTTHLPGLGEIVPPSPDVSANVASSSPQDIPVYPAAFKRLGLEPTGSMLSPFAAPVATAASGASAGFSKSTTLKSKLSGRLGLTSKDEAGTDANGANKVERKTPDSTLPNVLGRMRRSSGRGDSDRARTSSTATTAAAAELPAAWKDRIVAMRPSLDLRRPSLASLTSSSTHSSASQGTHAHGRASGTGSGATPLPAPSQVSPREEPRSRSSLGFRRMLNTITGTEHAVDLDAAEAKSQQSEKGTSLTTLEALAATTFESPTSARRALNSKGSLRRTARRQSRYESFMELSDDDDDDDLSMLSTSVEVHSEQSDTLSPYKAAARGPRKRSARKDLSKMFGASDVDLSHPSSKPSAAQEKRWTSSLGRSTTKKRTGLW